MLPGLCKDYNHEKKTMVNINAFEQECVACGHSVFCKPKEAVCDVPLHARKYFRTVIESAATEFEKINLSTSPDNSREISEQRGINSIKGGQCSNLYIRFM